LPAHHERHGVAGEAEQRHHGRPRPSCAEDGGDADGSWRSGTHASERRIRAPRRTCREPWRYSGQQGTAAIDGGRRRKFRRPQGRRARFRRFEASQHASFSGEVEGVMAELLGILSERGEPRNGREKRRPELGFRAREEKRTWHGTEMERIGSRERASWRPYLRPGAASGGAHRGRDRRREGCQAALCLCEGRRQRHICPKPPALCCFPKNN
jgi:hypothetical protein